MENTLVPARGYDLRHVPRVPLPRRPTADLLRLPGRLRGAVTAAGRILDEVHADAVVGFGGYVSVPAYLAARKRGLPIVVHEANARPGVANRLGARLTRFVAVSAPDGGLPHARMVGPPAAAQHRHPRPTRHAGDRAGPLRAGGRLPDAAGLRRLARRQAAQRARPWPPRPRWPPPGIQVLHAVGREHADTVKVAPGARCAALCDGRLTSNGWTWPMPPRTSPCAAGAR